MAKEQREEIRLVNHSCCVFVWIATNGGNWQSAWFEHKNNHIRTKQLPLFNQALSHHFGAASLPKWEQAERQFSFLWLIRMMGLNFWLSEKKKMGVLVSVQSEGTGAGWRGFTHERLKCCLIWKVLMPMVSISITTYWAWILMLIRLFIYSATHTMNY